MTIEGYRFDDDWGLALITIWGLALMMIGLMTIGVSCDDNWG